MHACMHAPLVLYYEGKHIVGIIGPRCSDSTKAVASLTGKSEIALINVHLGSAPELCDRSLYPYSFGINHRLEVSPTFLNENERCGVY